MNGHCDYCGIRTTCDSPGNVICTGCMEHGTPLVQFGRIRELLFLPPGSDLVESVKALVQERDRLVSDYLEFAGVDMAPAYVRLRHLVLEARAKSSATAEPTKWKE